jgi:hypothetical protein
LEASPTNPARSTIDQCNRAKRPGYGYAFVDYIPADLEADTVYVSTTYGTVAHVCACGCGAKVVTPLSPADWQLCFDGESVSLTPSIGNWSFPCRSHYWITNGHVHWAKQWSDAQIAAGRRREVADRAAYFRQRANQPSAPSRRPYETASSPRWWSRRLRALWERSKRAAR